MIEKDIREILVSVTELKGQVAAIEEARRLAKNEQDDWRDEIRSELAAIKTQTTLTNGKVQAHALVLARMGGVASVFSWWKPAVGGGLVAALAYYLTTL